MKKIISCILAFMMLWCSTVAFAAEIEVVVDTEVPEFYNLVDGKVYYDDVEIKDRWQIYILIAPFLVLFFLMTVLPVLSSVVLSFFNFDLFFVFFKRGCFFSQIIVFLVDIC